METIELDKLELAMVAYFSHGADMSAMMNCSSRFFNALEENFIPPRHEVETIKTLFSDTVPSTMSMSANINACGKFQLAQLIIEHGDRFFNMGLYEACHYGHIENAALMIANCANDLHRGLCIACEYGFADLIELILASGDHPFMESALQIACKNNHTEIVKKLIKMGAPISPQAFRDACFNGNLELVELFATMGEAYPDTGLSIACLLGNLELADLMIAYGADNFDHCLLIACEGHNTLAAPASERFELAKLMIEKGAKNLDMALEYACCNDHVELAKFLIEKGADPASTEGEYFEFKKLLQN